MPRGLRRSSSATRTSAEETRLRYRYVDLRRPEMFARLDTRSRITRAMREFLDAEGFVDIETPMLTRATPEGARDYLVPSRTHPGRFFALPQSPQLFKQLLMMAGFERYYQIARCFRDEDLRADRQPEFTQLDIETSFLDVDGIIGLMERLIRHVFDRVLGVSLPDPFPRMTYEEATSRYGIDRPDLRIPLELVEVGDLVAGCEFKVFAGARQRSRRSSGRAQGARGGRAGPLRDRRLHAVRGNLRSEGACVHQGERPATGRDGLQSPIVKFLSDEALAGIIERTGATDGDLVFFGADRSTVVNDALGALRVKLGEDLGLVEDGWKILWILNFPMFEWDPGEKRHVALHHPFTAPDTDDRDAIEANPSALGSRAYDMVLNGSEIGGGSIRIHRRDVQQAVFHVLGIGEEEARERFGFLLDALE